MIIGLCILALYGITTLVSIGLIIRAICLRIKEKEEEEEKLEKYKKY